MPQSDLIVCVVTGSSGPAWTALAETAGRRRGVALADVTRDDARDAGQFTLVGEPESLAAAARALLVDAVEQGVRVSEVAFVTVGRDRRGSALETGRQLVSSVARGLSGLPVPPLRLEARGPQVRFLVELDRDDAALAGRLALAVSEAGGGFPGVEARALPPAHGRHAEIEVTLRDPSRTPLVPVFSALEILSREAGALCLATRLFGLAPQAVVTRSVAADVFMRDFEPRAHQLERVVRGSLAPC